MAVAFPAADALLGRLTNVDAELSGSTGCCALFFPGNTLCVANCGDSRCVMGRTEGEAMAAYEMSSEWGGRKLGGGYGELDVRQDATLFVRTPVLILAGSTIRTNWWDNHLFCQC